MNPFLITAVSGAVVRALTRQCKRCGHQQVVAESKARQSVACDVCGATIMSRPSERQAATEEDLGD